MNGLNFQASVSNLAQMDRHQQELHRTPVTNQEQNAQIARDDAAQKTLRPMEPDGVEEKKVDPKQRKRDSEMRKKRNKKQGNTAKGKSTDSGFFLDIRI